MAQVQGSIHAADCWGGEGFQPGGHNVPKLIPEDAPIFFEWKEFFTPVFRNTPDITQYHHFCFDAHILVWCTWGSWLTRKRSRSRCSGSQALASQLVSCPCRLPTRGCLLRGSGISTRRCGPTALRTLQTLCAPSLRIQSLPTLSCSLTMLVVPILLLPSVPGQPVRTASRLDTIAQAGVFWHAPFSETPDMYYEPEDQFCDWLVL